MKTGFTGEGQRPRKTEDARDFDVILTGSTVSSPPPSGPRAPLSFSHCLAALVLQLDTFLCDVPAGAQRTLSSKKCLWVIAGRRKREQRRKQQRSRTGGLQRARGTY